MGGVRGFCPGNESKCGEDGRKMSFLDWGDGSAILFFGWENNNTLGLGEDWDVQNY